MTLENFAPASDANPTGFFEDIDLVWLLAGVGSVATEDESRPEFAGIKAAAVEALREGIAARCRDGVDWGAKTYLLVPHLPLVLELLAEHKVDVKIIRTVRPVADSIESWKRAVAGNGEWLGECATKIDSEIAKLSVPVLEMGFAETLDKPNESVASLAGFTGKTTRQDARDFINPALRSV